MSAYGIYPIKYFNIRKKKYNFFSGSSMSQKYDKSKVVKMDLEQIWMKYFAILNENMIYEQLVFKKLFVIVWNIEKIFLSTKYL